MKKKFTPDTLKKIRYLSGAAMHPQGEKIAFVRTKAAEEGQFASQIAELEIETGKSWDIEYSGAECRQKSPKYSPDGTYLAYLSDESGESQIYIRKSGEYSDRKITTLRHGVTYFAWSHGSESIVFTTPVFPEEKKRNLVFCEMGAKEKEEYLFEKEWEPVEIEEIDYKKDECFGLYDGSVSQMGMVTVKNGEQTLLSTAEIPCFYPEFSRDNTKIAYFAKPYKGPWFSALELFLYDVEQQNAVQITFDRKIDFSTGCAPQFSVDNAVVYACGYQMFEDHGFIETIYQISCTDGSFAPILDAADDSVTQGVGGMPIGRTEYGDAMPVFLTDITGEYLYFRNAWFGFENLYRVSLTGSKKIESVIVQEKNVHGFTLPIDGKMVILGGTIERMPELYQVSLVGKQNVYKQLTEENRWLAEYELGRVELQEVETTDQKAKIQVWVMHPAFEEPGKKYPAVLDIHGGPDCSYVSDFWHEFQAFAAQGMAVIYTNPRGSTGYGEHFNGSEYCWGKEAVEDLMLAIDTGISLGFIDKNRIGVTGGSYGGYMTNKLLGISKRFRAAASQRSLFNTASSYGTGDAGFISGGTVDVSEVKMLEFLEKRARSSLICKIDQMKTPLLILHGYKDYRCGFEQSEQLFVAMKERNPEVPVRLVMFPEENHGITRTGKISNQIRHLQEMCDWFEKYLADGEEKCADDREKKCTV